MLLSQPSVPSGRARRKEEASEQGSAVKVMSFSSRSRQGSGKLTRIKEPNLSLKVRLVLSIVSGVCSRGTRMIRNPDED